MENSTGNANKARESITICTIQTHKPDSSIVSSIVAHNISKLYTMQQHQ